MSDLVDRLRDVNHGWVPDIALEGADRIEELEREVENWRKQCLDAEYNEAELQRQLAAEKEAHKTCEFMMQTNASIAADLAVKIAAEKALAERLYAAAEGTRNPAIKAMAALFKTGRDGLLLADEIHKADDAVRDACAAYRKARGL